MSARSAAQSDPEGRPLNAGSFCRSATKPTHHFGMPPRLAVGAAGWISSVEIKIKDQKTCRLEALAYDVPRRKRLRA